MAKTPKKSIFRRIADIRWPASSRVVEEESAQGPPPTETVLRNLPETPSLEDETLPKKSHRLFKEIFFTALFVTCGTALVVYASFYYAQKRALRGASESVLKFQSGVEDLKALRSGDAEEKFKDVNRDLTMAAGTFPGNLIPFLRQGGELLRDFQAVTNQGMLLAEEIASLQANAFDYLFEGHGDKLIAHIEKIQELVQQINDASGRLSSIAVKLKEATPFASQLYFPFQLEASRVSDFLSALIGYLKSEETHHIAVFFQNNSEMRPTGGFLGSYADVTLKRGQVGTIAVRNINDVDRGFHTKIVPPKPLQLVAAHWKVADMNWFFDFSDSASKILKAMEASDAYKAQSVSFDGAAALSPKVIGDLLALTGPIELSEEHLVLDQNNFLAETQKEVVQGERRKIPTPKRILSELTPALIARLTAIDAPVKRQLFDLAQDWVKKKDVMVYFKDADFEDFFDTSNAAGKVYTLPQNFEGDYLAIVDSNIGGGKSDLFVKQKVVFQSQLDATGVVSDHLVVRREHRGDLGHEWWYKIPNQDYLRVFTPPQSDLDTLKGGVKKVIVAPLKYTSRTDYAVDPLIQTIESSVKDFFNYPAIQSFTESGKNVFATWSKMSVGHTDEIVLDYTHRLFLAPTEGTTYQFVFEKQAGSRRDYDFIISAPVGFRFAENSLPVFEYVTGNPPGRFIINLTLEKF